MDEDEKTLAERVVRNAVEAEGYDVLRLKILPNRSIILVLDQDPGKVTLDDCVYMNRRIRRAFEGAGLPVDDYSIEVESPGINRPLLALKDYRRFKGQRARLKLRQPVRGQKVHRGILAGVKGETIRLDDEEGPPLDLTLDDIEEARLDPKLPF